MVSFARPQTLRCDTSPQAYGLVWGGHAAIRATRPCCLVWEWPRCRLVAVESVAEQIRPWAREGDVAGDVRHFGCVVAGPQALRCFSVAGRSVAITWAATTATTRTRPQNRLGCYSYLAHVCGIPVFGQGACWPRLPGALGVSLWRVTGTFLRAPEGNAPGTVRHFGS